MKLNDYQKDDGYEYEGCFYPTATDLLQTGLLGFCGCGGCPENNLLYILEGLTLINHYYEDNRDDFNQWFEYYQKDTKKLFKTEESKYFFYYWTEKEGLTEHGSSVPGWLTPKGHDFMVSPAKT